MPAPWHGAAEINGKLDGMWEMCVFAIDSSLWCSLSAQNEWEVVECKNEGMVGVCVYPCVVVVVGGKNGYFQNQTEYC